MQLNSGELYTLATDPMLILMARECEDVDDELELAAISDQREKVLADAILSGVARRSFLKGAARQAGCPSRVPAGSVSIRPPVSSPVKATFRSPARRSRHLRRRSRGVSTSVKPPSNITCR